MTPQSTEAPAKAEGATPASPDSTKVVDTLQTTTQQASEQASTQAKAAEQQAQGLIDKAKSLLAEQKYQDALASLNQLANTQLTTEQQKLVADLKTQIQNGLSKAAVADSASALGNALGGKK